MTKALIFKEWIKTRWYLLVCLTVMIGFAAYAASGAFRAVELRGAGHIWEVMVTRDAIFVDILRYVPLAAGFALAIVQFVPEMQKKCLKLTLHLPCSILKTTAVMIAYGLCCLTICFMAMSLTGILPLGRLFPHEMISRIFLSMLPWILGGYSAYIFTSWIIIEPSWKMRIAYIAISALALRIFFLAPGPEAYNIFLPWLSAAVIFSASLIWLSVLRFKAGVQD